VARGRRGVEDDDRLRPCRRDRALGVAELRAIVVLVAPVDQLRMA